MPNIFIKTIKQNITILIRYGNKTGQNKKTSTNQMLNFQ